MSLLHGVALLGAAAIAGLLYGLALLGVLFYVSGGWSGSGWRWG